MDSKQIRSMIMGLVALSASGLHAECTEAQCRNLENRVSALEQRKGASGIVTPSARPQVKEAADLFITADCILWQAHSDGVGFTTKSQSNTSLVNGKTKHPEFEWNWGFKLGVGYDLTHDGWDLRARYTRIHNAANKEISVPNGEALFFLLTNAATGVVSQNATSARDHWNVHLNIVDLEVGREYYISKRLAMRPFMGLETAWIIQHEKNKFQGGTAAPLAGSAFRTFERHKYWGLGLRVGIDGNWHLGQGWSIFSNTALNVLYGFFDIHNTSRTELANGTTTGTQSSNDGYHVSKTITEVVTGLSWDRMLAEDRCHLGIRAGWEHHLFLNQNQEARISKGDLTIQGYTLRVRVDF